MNKYSNDFVSAENEMILYQPDSSISLNVKVEDETVWLTQAQMTELFQSSKQNISLPINNLFTRVRDKNHHKKLNRQLGKVADSFGNITDI